MSKICFEKNQELDYRSKESYNTIRTNLLFSGNDVKVILLTSCTCDEGKSSVSFYLAQSFALMGKRVLLIDADLRKSVFVGRYRITGSSTGLSQYLSGQSNFEDVLYETDVPNMDMILAGKTPPNPSELLGSEVFQKMIEDIREEYDYVIVDSPPLGSVIDAAVMAPFCDGTILVIEQDKINKRFAKEVKGQLEKTKCRILGVILNKMDVNRGEYYYGGYYRKYYSKNSYM